ncbi:MAG: NHLP bacteriocin system secretion protein [Defluviicoccus sp.]|nr:MAG: NHLP bacteriocin system secretion protein [Defluviicoccus sp.]
MMPSIFRETALKKLRDPEQLDSALTLASPKGWLALAAIGVVIAAVLIWAFVGTLPFQVQGLGILLRKGGVVFTVNAPSGGGTVSAIQVRVGDNVVTGQGVLTLTMPALEKQIEEAKRNLADLRSRYQRQSGFTQKDIARRKNVESQVQALNEKLLPPHNFKIFMIHLQNRKNDLQKGYVTRQQYETTLSNLYSATQSIRDYRNQISQILTGQTEYENQLLRTLAELEEQVIEAEGQVQVLETSLVTEAVIPSPTDGTVTEVAVQLGDVVVANQVVALIEQGGELQLYGYFPVGQAKRVSAGMLANVTPTSVESDIYGSIRGSVTEVGALAETAEGVQSIVGNESVVQQIMAAGPPIQIVVSLERDPATVSGLKWSSSVGPPIPITPGTMANVRVTVRNDRPVDLVVPIYETWVGIH